MSEVAVKRRPSEHEDYCTYCEGRLSEVGERFDLKPDIAFRFDYQHNPSFNIYRCDCAIWAYHNEHNWKWERIFWAPRSYLGTEKHKEHIERDKEASKVRIVALCIKCGEPRPSGKVSCDDEKACDKRVADGQTLASQTIGNPDWDPVIKP